MKIENPYMRAGEDVRCISHPSTELPGSGINEKLLQGEELLSYYLSHYLSVYAGYSICATELVRYPLVVLQLVEVGLLQLMERKYPAGQFITSSFDSSASWLPPELRAGQWRKSCLVCGIEDVLEECHIFNKNPEEKCGLTRSSGGVHEGDELVGTVYMCSNDHQGRIHRRNPFTLKNAPPLYHDPSRRLLKGVQVYLQDLLLERYVKKTTYPLYWTSTGTDKEDLLRNNWLKTKLELRIVSLNKQIADDLEDQRRYRADGLWVEADFAECHLARHREMLKKEEDRIGDLAQEVIRLESSADGRQN